jgi:hypothetical protein
MNEGGAMAHRPMLVYAAAYADREDAELDYELVRRMYTGGTVTVFDATLFVRDAGGRAKVVNTVEGLFFPPCLLRDASAEPDAESRNGLFWRALSDQAVEQLAALFRQGGVWLVAITSARLQHVLRDPARRVIAEVEAPLVGDAWWNLGTDSREIR